MITIYLQNGTTLHFEDVIEFHDNGLLNFSYKVLDFSYKVFNIDTVDDEFVNHARFDKEKIIGYSVSENII